MSVLKIEDGGGEGLEFRRGVRWKVYKLVFLHLSATSEL